MLHTFWLLLLGRESAAPDECSDLHNQQNPRLDKILHHLEPRIAQLESQRACAFRSTSLRTRLALLGILAALVAGTFAISTPMITERIPAPAALIGGSVSVIVAGLFFWASSHYRAFRARFQSDILSAVLSFAGDGFTYDPFGTVKISELKSQHTIPDHDEAKQTDQLTGSILGFPVTLVNLRLRFRQNGGEQRKTGFVFDGLLAHLATSVPASAPKMQSIDGWTIRTGKDHFTFMYGNRPMNWLSPPHFSAPLNIQVFVAHTMNDVERILDSLTDVLKKVI